MKKLLKILEIYCLDKEVIGCTPKLGTNRGTEIKEYLVNCKFTNTINFVILDDDEDMDLLPYLVHINSQSGLTKENVHQAIKILTKGSDNYGYVSKKRNEKK